MRKNIKYNVLRLLIINIIFIVNINVMFAEGNESVGNSDSNNTNNTITDINATSETGISNQTSNQMLNQTANQTQGIDYSDYVNKEPREYLNPTTIGLTSLFIPGTGQMINGFYVKGTVHLGLMFALRYGMDYTERKRVDAYQEENNKHKKRHNYKKADNYEDQYDALSSLDVSLGFYSTFDAFRDARRINEAHGTVYYQPVTTETATELWLAPFNYENFLDPFVVLPLLYLLCDTNSARNIDPYYSSYQNKEIGAMSGLTSGVGEETFFRGFLYPASAELTQSHFLGGAMESAIFVSLHERLNNTLQLNEFMMSSYLTYVSYRNNYTLGHNIALRSWWKTIISLSLIKQIEYTKDNPIKHTYNIMSFGFTF